MKGRYSTNPTYKQFFFYEKIVLLGSDDVGKKTVLKLLLNCPVEETPQNESVNAKGIYNSNTFIDIYQIKTELFSQDGTPLKCQFFVSNTTNNEILTSLSFQCLCFIIFFDKTNYQSFAYAQKVLTLLRESYIIDNNAKFLFISNKHDIQDKDTHVKEDEVETYIKTFPNIIYIKLSAQTNLNISKLKDSIISIFFKENIIRKCNTTQREKCPYYSKQFIHPIPYKEEETPLTYKIILLGDSTVGKTAYFQKILQDKFFDKTSATIGLTEGVLHFRIEEQYFRVEIWDTAGQDRFRAIPKKYYERVDGVMLLYDISNEETFEGVSKWLNDIREITVNNLVIYLLGNKLDLIEEREVELEDGRKLAKEKEDMKFVEISAKWDLNIRDVLYMMIIDIYFCSNPQRRTILMENKKHKEKDKDKKKCCK